MATGELELALVKCRVDTKHLFPDDDYLMAELGFPKYTKDMLNIVDEKKHKHLWKASLENLGSVACRPQDIKVMGITHFNGRGLLNICDPVICKDNYKYLGGYYRALSDMIFEGRDVSTLPMMSEYFNDLGRKGE